MSFPAFGLFSCLLTILLVFVEEEDSRTHPVLKVSKTPVPRINLSHWTPTRSENYHNTNLRQKKTKKRRKQTREKLNRSNKNVTTEGKKYSRNVVTTTEATRATTAATSNLEADRVKADLPRYYEEKECPEEVCTTPKAKAKEGKLVPKDKQGAGETHTIVPVTMMYTFISRLPFWLDHQQAVQEVLQVNLHWI